MNYNEQVKLLLEVLPYIRQHDCFALKGGTAINLFHLDMPRLSVDIDLTYVYLKERNDALNDMQTALHSISDSIKKLPQHWNVFEKKSSKFKRIMKLIISNDNATIKIEPNEILRGTVYPIQKLDLCEKVQTQFNLEITEFPCLSKEDLYGGKLCAALDRQHPRDLFDIWQLQKREGLTKSILNAFVVYLACHSRPMAELLSPNPKRIRESFEGSFTGMAQEEVSVEVLEQVRNELPYKIVSALDDRQKGFLLSIKKMQVDWGLLSFEHIQHLPGIRWKLLNLGKMGDQKRRVAIRKLEEILV